MNILHQLYKLIGLHDTSNRKQLSIIKVMNYLLGNNYEKSFSDNTLYNLYNNKTHLSYNNLHNLALFKGRDAKWLSQCISESIDIPGLSESANSLLQEIQSSNKFIEQNIPNESDLSSVMDTLVFLHFFHVPDPHILFRYNERGTCKNYVHCSSIECEISSALTKNNFLILSGNPGSGKKQVLINTLPKYCLASQTDTFWLDAPKSSSIPLKEQLLGISFMGDENRLNMNQLLERLKMKKSSSILIIDRPTFTDDDLSFCLEFLLPMKLKIIITTYRKSFPDTFTIVDVDKRPVDNLIEIFHEYHPDSDFTNDDIRTLLEIVESNVHVLSLIARALSKNDGTITKDMLLNDSEWIWEQTKTTKLHSSYHDSVSKSEDQLLALIGRILSNYNSALLVNSASELSIWTKTPISQDLLSIKWSPSVISECIAGGILQYYDANSEKLFMPRLIADTIWRNTPIDYDEYKEKIFKFIDTIENGKSLSLPYDDLYKMLFNMILRFHFQVTIMPSRIDNHSKENFQQWNKLLADIIERYMEFGNYHYAEHVLPYLYASRNKKGKIINPSELQIATQNLLRKQIACMKVDDMYVGIDNIHKFLLTLDKSLVSSNSDTEIINHLCSLIIKDMANCAIDMTLTLVAEEPRMNYDNFLNGLEKLSSLMKKSNTYYARFLKIVFHYFSATLNRNCQFYHLRKANAYRNPLLYDTGISPVLQFHIRALSLYFTFVIFYIKGAGNETNIFEQEYNGLFEAFQKSMWPYHPSHAFYSCTFLLAGNLPDFKEKCTYRNLLKSMEDYKSFIHTQLSLSRDQIKEHIVFADTMINEFLSGSPSEYFS